MNDKNIFEEYNIPELLGLTPVSMVSDREIFEHLVSPQVKALLGDVQERTITVREQTEGDFIGDEVSNLNDHRLYGGQKGFVRFPYINTVYKTAYGALIIKRDGLKFKVFAWTGKMHASMSELIFKAALRDRRFDGSLKANETSLLDFPYHDPVNALIIPGAPTGSTSVELSVYGFIPGSQIVDATGDRQFHDFVANPFTFIDRPKLFLRLFKRAWKSKRSPGQVGSAVPDVTRFTPGAMERFAIAQGYDYIENASSHYHVAKWAESIGYRYSDPDQGAALACLTAGIKRVKEGGLTLTRPQESWLCVIQSLPRQFIADQYYMGGCTWPQDNISQVNLWMYKPLSERAKAATLK
ncbi:MAG: hypothetical protein K8F91_18605 [Candidatus Obscuribacterales bacterium]|nr:hypothetical protein [Candidatus Obscuribacterales bacterium]